MDCISQIALDLNLALGNTGKINYKYSDNSTAKHGTALIFIIGGTANITLTNKFYLTIDLTGASVGDRQIINEDYNIFTDKERTTALHH